MQPHEFYARKLAKAIAVDLMSNGKQTAERLVLNDKDGGNLGCWSNRGLEQRIHRHLIGELTENLATLLLKEELDGRDES